MYLQLQPDLASNSSYTSHMDYTIGAARITMCWGLGLQLCFGIVLSTNPGFGSAVSDALVNRQQQQQQQQQQQIAPLVVPQWWWLSSLLSLPHGHRSHTTAAAAASAGKVVEADESPLSEADPGTLSLVLSLDQLPNGDDSLPSPQSVGRVAKRGSLCRGSGRRGCRRGDEATVSADKVRRYWEAEFISIPDALVSFSQKLAEENVCKGLSVQLFPMDLEEHYLEPRWVRETVRLGSCPSMLQERHLGNNVWPSSVVEVKCLCEQHSCSNIGGDFRCQTVRRPVRTWVLTNNQNFVLVEENLSVGCVCVQRTGTQANQLGE